jgi:hypothetical protein
MAALTEACSSGLAPGEADVLEFLRHRIELAGQRAHRLAVLDHHGQHLQRREQAVAGGGVVATG